MDIKKLMLRAEQAIPHSVENYPRSSGLEVDSEEEFAFYLRHVNHHLQKAGGSIATMLERFDHDNTVTFDRDELKVVAMKLLINTARLCVDLVMDGKEIEELTEKLFPNQWLKDTQYIGGSGQSLLLRKKTCCGTVLTTKQTIYADRYYSR